MKFLSFLLLLGVSGYSASAQSLPTVYAALETNYLTNAFENCVRMEKEVEAFTRNRFDTLSANCFFYIGDAYHQLGQIKKALPYFEREKELLHSLGLSHTSDYSNSLNNLAYLYLQDGDYVRAGMTADQLLETDRKLFSEKDEAFVMSVLNVADIYLQLDRLKDAEALMTETLRSQPKKSVNHGLLLNKLGDHYSYRGQYTRASKALNEALDVHAEVSGEESAEYVSAAINMGILYMNQGKYPEAEEVFDVALSKLDASEPAYASVLNNHALVLQSLGQLERAAKSLSTIRQMDSLSVGTAHPDYAITLSNLGLVYADMTRFKEAEQVLNRALAIQKSNDEGHTLSYAGKLNNLAKVYQMSGTPQKSISLLEHASSTFKKNLGKQSPEYATSQYNLGVALWKSGKGEAGFKLLRSSANIRAKVLGKTHPHYAQSMLKIAEYQWQKKMIKETQQSFGEVFQNYYFQIDETFPVLTEEEKTKFYYTNIRTAFDKFNSLAVRHHEKNPALLNDAFNYVINTKAAIMFATEKVQNAIRTSGDPYLVQQFELWQATKEQIAKLYSLNQENVQLDSLLKASNFLEKELARKSSAFEGQFSKKKYAREQIQKSLKAGEAAVEVLRFQKFDPDGGDFTEEIQYAFLVVTPDTKEAPALILMENGNDLETKFLKYYRNNIKYQTADAYSYRNYFEPLADHLRQANIRRVYFSPDGVYNQINMNSIENPATKKFLIDEYDIRIVTNTRELVQVKPGIENEQSSVLIGYPKFNLEGVHLKASGSSNATRSVSRTWRGGLLRYMRGEAGISVLPGTQVEIEKVKTLFGDRSHAYTDGDASERTAKTVSHPRVLHIATHGYFLEDATQEVSTSTYISNPLLNAGLILAGAENFLKTGELLNEEGDDGILTAYEAMNLDLDNTQLVVLSACETALGDVQNGEGVYGLQRAFKLAGARSIVMSLWNVDDDATQQLMTTFYKEMLSTGDQHQAFRNAQQAVKEKYPSPFYWGAFIMVGI